MPLAQLIIEILEIAATTAAAAARARAAYESVRQAMKQTHELTPEQEADLDARAEAIFSSEASKPSGR